MTPDEAYVKQRHPRAAACAVHQEDDDIFGGGGHFVAEVVVVTHPTRGDAVTLGGAGTEEAAWSAAAEKLRGDAERAEQEDGAAGDADRHGGRSMSGHLVMTGSTTTAGGGVIASGGTGSSVPIPPVVVLPRRFLVHTQNGTVWVEKAIGGMGAGWLTTG